MSHESSRTGPDTDAAGTCALDTVKPAITKSASAPTFRKVSPFWITRPGPSPRAWINAKARMIAIATRARTDTVNASGPARHEAMAAAFPASGTNRSRYTAMPTAPAAEAPENPATNAVQPVRNAARPPKLSRR